jgi:hypothetical protein
VAYVTVRLANEEGRQRKPSDGERDAEIERLRAQTVDRGEMASRERGAGDGEIAGELVQSHREAALLGACEIDLHDHRRRPGEALAHAEKHVGSEHPVPRRRRHQ